MCRHTFFWQRASSRAGAGQPCHGLSLGSERAVGVGWVLRTRNAGSLGCVVAAEPKITERANEGQARVGAPKLRTAGRRPWTIRAIAIVIACLVSSRIFLADF